MAVDENQKPPTTTTATPPAATHHILMVVLSAQGHMNPLLRLGKRLHSKGLRVTFATPDIARHRHTLNNSATDSSVDVPGIHLEFFSDGLSLEAKRTDMDQYFDCINRFGPIHLSNLVTDLHTRPIPKISCIVTNPFVPWVADVAAQHHIPCAMMWIQPCSLLSIYYRFYNHLSPFQQQPHTANNGEHNTAQDGAREIVAVDIPGLPLLHTVDLPSFILPSNTVKSIVDMLAQSLKPAHNYNWILANSFHELETEVIESISGLIPVKPVGPLVSWSLLSDVDNDQDDSGLDMWKADVSCIEWLDQQAPCSVIYVSFGSLLSLSKDTMENIASALKRSKRPFLWVAKAPDNEVDVRGVGAGEAQTLAEFMEATKEQGRVVAWCPQSRVLKHPALGCFLTHCGWNSVMEAVTTGVPLVCYPQWTDQPTNAKLVVDVFGVGLRIWPDKDGGIGAEEIERCIEDVMVGPAAEAIRARAAEWRRAAREAVAEGGSSDRNIQWFVDEIVKSSSVGSN